MGGGGFGNNQYEVECSVGYHQTNDIFNFSFWILAIQADIVFRQALQIFRFENLFYNNVFFLVLENIKI